MKGTQIIALLAILLVLPCQLALAETQPQAETSDTQAVQLPSEAFSRLPQFVRPRLSPDGKTLAYIRNLQDPALSMIGVTRIDDGKTDFLVKSDNEKIKIRWYRWANNRTLIVSLIFASSRNFTDTSETRLVAVDADDPGAEARLLIRPRASRHVSQFQDDVIDFLPHDDEHILIALDNDKQNMPSVYKLNIYTKKKMRLERGKRQIRDWMTDQQGRLRVGMSLDYKQGTAKTFVRDDEDDDWRELFKFNALEDPISWVRPVGFDLDPNVLYYRKYLDGMLALYKVKLDTNEHELVYADPEHDVDGSLKYSDKTQGIIGLYHRNTPNGIVYWDKGRENFQKAIDASLPDTENSLASFSMDETRYLLYTESDHMPGAYYLGDRKAGTLTLLLEQYPELVDSVEIDHRLVTYRARDGVEIEGYLTVPAGIDKPVPTILHPHGGPNSRDSAGFDYWTSFFVNRGYAVFRPNFRGSSGYGFDFAQSQVKGWGLTMQDDLTDAAHWLIEQEVAISDKICIVGGSYGGYAATMAAVKTPDLFACAVSFAGVTDLKKLVFDSRKYTNRKFVKNQIGDDRSDLIERSPAFHAEKVKIPILLVHGEDDRIVDVNQSRIMAEELEDEDKTFTYIELENGDHYLSLQRNRHAFFKAMDSFLGQHLQ